MAVFYRKVSLEVLKEKYRKALEKSGGEIKGAAKIVGHSRPTFTKYARKFGLIRKRRSPRVQFQGQRKTFPQWSKHTGIPTHILYKRVWNGMPVSEALTRPHEKKAA